MRKVIATVLAIIMIGAIGLASLSRTNASVEGEITVHLNGRKIEFDVAPIIENGRTLVPIRAIFEALDMEVTYYEGAIVAEKEGLKIELTVDSDIALVNGERIILDVPGRIIDGRTFVPLRFVGESTGLTVNYDSNTRVVTMNALANTALAPKNHDLRSDWDNSSATIITLNGGAVLVEGSGATASGGVVTISQAGTYVVSGTLTNGQIVVDATKDDRVHLVLNGVEITNRTGAAIYAPVCDKLILTLADGTNNTVTDGGSNFSYTLVDDEEPNAAIFSKNDLTINGTGTLTVNAGFNNGIGTKDDLLIVSGNFIINAANHGLRGNDSVGIVSGMFDITAGSDGIRTNNDSNESRGWIHIEDGTFDIKAQKDGIQAENNLSITGGVFIITTGDGSANAPVRMGGFGDGRQGGMGGMPPMGGQPPMNGRQPQPQATVTETDDESTSMKALKARTQINITGGAFTIDAEDDGVHSDGDVFISGGNLSIKTGDDGIHADNAVVITGGVIDIPVCYEGIEGLSVTISNGTISIIASDDGINAASAGDSDIFGGGRTQGDFPQDWLQREMPEFPQGEWPDQWPNQWPDRQPGRQPGFPQDSQQGRPQGGQGPQGGGMSEPRFSITDDAFIRISGGEIDIVASGDGIDSNGHVYIEGGLIKINGPSMGAEGAIEMDGDFIVTGGEIITAGSVYSLTEGSAQPLIRVSYTRQHDSGSLISVKDSDGVTLLEYTSKMAFTASGFTSPSFRTGQTYSVYINGEKCIDVTINDLTTSISDNGGAYSAGMGGRPGGMGR